MPDPRFKLYSHQITAPVDGELLRVIVEFQKANKCKRTVAIRELLRLAAAHLEDDTLVDMADSQPVELG